MTRIRITLASIVVLAGFTACDNAPYTHEQAPRPRVRILEERDGLYTRDHTGALRRITARRVGSFDFDSLAAKQREGLVILYWAAAPALSPDGRLVAYATNREAVAADTGGQSIWLLDLTTGAERALLHEPGRSFRPIGWLDDDVVYIADEPGVHLVDPATGRRRRLADGVHLAVATSGSAVLVAAGLPDSVRVAIHTGNDVVPLPDPPAPFRYLPDARFFDDDRQLLLEAARDSGVTRRFFAFDTRTRRLHALNRDAPIGNDTLRAVDIQAALERTLPAGEDGRSFCSWTILGSDVRGAYVWSLCEEWRVGVDGLERRTARSAPVALSRSPDGTVRTQLPRDGDRYRADVRRIFPADVRRLFDDAYYVAALEVVNAEIAKRCFERSSVPCIPLQGATLAPRAAPRTQRTEP